MSGGKKGGGERDKGSGKANAKADRGDARKMPSKENKQPATMVVSGSSSLHLGSALVLCLALAATCLRLGSASPMPQRPAVETISVQSLESTEGVYRVERARAAWHTRTPQPHGIDFDTWNDILTQKEHLLTMGRSGVTANDPRYTHFLPRFIRSCFNLPRQLESILLQLQAGVDAGYFADGVAGLETPALTLSDDLRTTAAVESPSGTMHEHTQHFLCAFQHTTSQHMAHRRTDSACDTPVAPLCVRCVGTCPRATRFLGGSDEASMA